MQPLASGAHGAELIAFPAGCAFLSSLSVREMMSALPVLALPSSLPQSPRASDQENTGMRYAHWYAHDTHRQIDMGRAIRGFSCL